MPDRSPSVADVIVTDARVYTGDPTRPWATSFSVAGGRIIAIDEPEAHRGPSTVARSMGGGFAMPGLVDGHNHHSLAGRSDLYELTFSSTLDADGVFDAIAAYAPTLPEGAWVLGGSWGSGLMATFNTAAARARLDEVSAGHPVMLSDDSHHNRWVNSAALRIAGVDDDTVPDHGGVILRDPDDGSITGVLLEAAGIAVAKAAERIAPLDAAAQRASSRRGIEVLSSFGITAFQDAAVSLPIMRALAELDEAGELNAWVVSSMTINDHIFGFDPVGADLIARGEEFRTAHHRPDFIKIFLDGVPPARTAAFLDPYLADAEHGEHYCGGTAIPLDELDHWLSYAAERGLSAKVHCTGDGSARAFLDAVERIREADGPSVRYQLAHGSFLSEQDLPRLVALDVSADISPFLWFPGVIPEAVATAVPQPLASRMHPNRDLLDVGTLVAGGSDWPVSESPNPWEGIQGLVTRADPLRRAPGTLWPEQAITLEEAIAVFSRNGAQAMGLGAVTGSIEVGKSADVAFLDRNPFELPVDELISTRAVETWFAGRPVYTAGAVDVTNDAQNEKEQ